MYKCKNCGKEFTEKYSKYSNGNYCCKECYEKHYNQRKRDEYNARQDRLKKESTNHCLYCGEPIPEGRKFCTSACSCKYIHSQKLKEVELNNGVGCYFHRIKEYLIEKRGHKCEICGNEEWMGQPIPLILDYINGRASDDRLENLRLVCANCDAQLPTYKSKNKNSDRKRVGRYK